MLPPGANTVTLSHPGAGGQHVADLIMVLVWVVVLLVALVRLRRKLRSEWTKTNLELSTPGADVPEIDWSSIWEEQSVG